MLRPLALAFPAGGVNDQNGEGVISAARVFGFCHVGSGAAERFLQLRNILSIEKSQVLFCFFDWLMCSGRPDGNRAEQGASLSAGSGTLICH